MYVFDEKMPENVKYSSGAFHLTLKFSKFATNYKYYEINTTKDTSSLSEMNTPLMDFSIKGKFRSSSRHSKSKGTISGRRWTALIKHQHPLFLVYNVH